MALQQLPPPSGEAAAVVELPQARRADLEPLILEPLRQFHRLPIEDERMEGDSNLDDWRKAPDGTLLSQTSWDEYDALSDDDDSSGGNNSEQDYENGDDDENNDEEEEEETKDEKDEKEEEEIDSDAMDAAGGGSSTVAATTQNSSSSDDYYVRLQSGQFRRIFEHEKDWRRRQRLEQALYDEHNCVRQFPLMRDMFRLGEEYQFHNCLSNDGNTAVYSARQRSTGYPVVLKITKHRFIHDQPRELSLLAKVQGHRGLPRVLGWHPMPETRSAAIVMDMLHKDSITRCVFKRRDKIRTFMHQLLSALAFIHEQHIIHRDVKTSNIVWNDEHSHLILLDFDIATFFHPECNHRYTQFVGTEGFIAPEVKAVYRHNKRRGAMEEQQLVQPFSSAAAAATPPWGTVPSTAAAAVPPSLCSYNQKVDVFSAGVVMAQLVYGVRERQVAVSQTSKRSATGLRKRSSQRLRTLSPTDPERAYLELLRALLQANPAERPTALQALTSPFFQQH